MRTRANWLGRIIATTVVLGTIAAGAAQAQNTYTHINTFGSYYRPFAADSLWNLKPVDPVLGTNGVKKPLINLDWIPSIGDGAYSVKVFMAKAGDPAMTVIGTLGLAGVGDPDTGNYRTIKIPRWPADVAPATGEDGHAEIIDTVTGVIHSFYQLRKVGGKWRATMYSWTRVDGRGFGNPSHWSQGARSAGVAPTAGLIRLHEINDNRSHYRHALAMSLPSHTLANGITHPSYVYPATTADTSAWLNTGVIPLGARLMLPESFDTSKLSTSALRKIANTLKLYGAYVVDRNYDTAFRLYVENGASFSIMPNGTWNTRVVSDLDKIRAGLREVVSVGSYADDNNAAKAASTVKVAGEARSLLSMRGDWLVPGTSTPANAAYDTWLESVSFPTTTKKISTVNYSNGISKVTGSMPAAKTPMRFTARTAGGALIRLQLWDGSSLAYDSGYLADGSFASFTWPAATVSVRLLAQSGVGTASRARGVLVTE
ncbi:hypothetical protein J2X54_004582 [Duganella sp. 3397]|uniref:Atrophin-1 multi-domain protein n=1 Tax=Duganella phyllosphaerae TaxID=762836 RepID=A0A1E7X0W4_9BURK|nr:MULTISPECIES: hypothetical protein [Duganella]MDR7052080.1 hypothetical protein [Duganella sp. 3397]OFA05940.1 hypothetical protein DUPY_14210 [Duganella phyllosphaerae]